MAIGFVYILGNMSMPGIYKVGCTSKSPAARAVELSAATGCPEHFDVICFWEGEDYQQFETELHDVFSQNRVNERREFFFGPLSWLVSCADAWQDKKYGFYITKMGEFYLRDEKRHGTC